MGADGKSAEIEVNPPLTIEPDTDNAGVGNFFIQPCGIPWLNFFIWR
jgi:hypothetical protein